MCKRRLILVLLFFVSSSAHAHQFRKELGIASFNLAWFGTISEFRQHHNVCQQVSWCDSRPKYPITVETLTESDACQAAFNNAVKNVKKSSDVPPCNAYMSSAKVPPSEIDYEKKLNGLRQTIARLIEGEKPVDVFAFQEISGEAALRDLFKGLIEDFDICVTQTSLFQNIAFAWRKSITSIKGICRTEETLAIPEDKNKIESKMLRPGLTLELNVANKKIAFLNVHLKSACANLHPSDQFAGRLLTDPDAACRSLNRQVRPLEQWIERVAEDTPAFILLGDFNRRIDEEARAAVPPHMVRTDKTFPSSSHTFRNKMDEGAEITTRYLWQEIADGHPASSKMHQVPLNDESSRSCLGFRGLDHIVISNALKNLQGATALTSWKTAVSSNDGIIKTSDHCPRIFRFKI